MCVLYLVIYGSAADIFNFVYTLAQIIKRFQQIKLFKTQMHRRLN